MGIIICCKSDNPDMETTRPYKKLTSRSILYENPNNDSDDEKLSISQSSKKSRPDDEDYIGKLESIQPFSDQASPTHLDINILGSMLIFDKLNKEAFKVTYKNGFYIGEIFECKRQGLGKFFFNNKSIYHGV